MALEAEVHTEAEQRNQLDYDYDYDDGNADLKVHRLRRSPRHTAADAAVHQTRSTNQSA